MRSFLALMLCGCGAGSLPDVVEPEPSCAAIAVSPTSLSWRDTRIDEPASQVVEVSNRCDVPVFLHTSVEGPALFHAHLDLPYLEPREVRSLRVDYTAVDGALQEATLGFHPWGGVVSTVEVDGRAETDWDEDGHVDHRAGGLDCDDDDPAVNPGVDEVCNGVDDDCSGEVDDLVRWWFADRDGDGWGGASVAGGCEPAEVQVDTSGDCDDTDPDTHPGAEDPVCDGVDRDCDGRTDSVAAMIGVAEYQSIQAAIDAAASGEEVEVCPGTHSEALVVEGVELTLSSRSGDPADTVLDGLRSHRILSLEGGEVAIRSLGFTRGSSDDTGGALFARVDALSLEGCSFSDSEAVQGGAVMVEVAEDSTGGVLIRDCTFDDNAASESGGAVAVIVDREGAETEISDCTFTANNAMIHGGGVYWSGAGDSTLTIDGSTFDGNSADAGGGARLVGRSDSITLTDSTFSGNHAREGGGLDVRGELLSQWCSFTGNTSISGGGAAYLVGESMLEETILDGNIAVRYGSALYAGGGTVLKGCTVTSNSTTGAQPGGAVYLPGASDLESIDTDWGQGTSDNSPADLCTTSGCDETLGASESFTCTDGSC